MNFIGNAWRSGAALIAACVFAKGKLKNLVVPFAKLPRALTRANPLWYLAAYAISVPAFAVYYCTVPHGFHAPNARLEEEGVADARDAANVMQLAIGRELTALSARAQSSVQKWYWDPPLINRVSTDDGGKLSFTLNLALRDRPILQGSAVLAFSIDATMASNGRWVSGAPGPSQKYFRLLEIAPGQVPWSKDDYQGQVGLEDRIQREFRMIPVTMDEEKRLSKVFDGLSGNAIAINGEFFRMLYFSAIVITTVGFGDIVPISQATRMAVALEALFGIILAGLFINAIAYRSAHSSS